MSSSAPSNPLLAVFHDSYHDLVRFVARRTDRQTARDLVHDAWLRLAERQSHGAPETPCIGEEKAQRAYLYAVAENIAIDHLRRSQRTAERFDVHAADHDASFALAPDVADVHTYRQALLSVEETLCKLPVRCRDIFLADRMEGATHADLAAQHGVSVKTVEREVMRAMDGVEAALRQWRGDAAMPRAGRRRALSALLGVAGMGLDSAGIWQAWRQWMPEYAVSLAAATGRLLTRTLPDGSTIELDAQSRVQVLFTGARRSVQLLSGSAFFAVAADAARPFQVQAQDVRITVVGTRFEVALEPQGVRVSVQEGRVQVQAPGRDVLALNGGDQVLLRPGQPPERTTSTGAVAPWRDGWLEFHHTPLSEAIERLGRYSAQAMSVEPDAAELRVLARVRIADARQWLRLLPGSLPVSVRESGDGAIYIARR